MTACWSRRFRLVSYSSGGWNTVGYASSYPSPEREDIVDRVSARIETPDDLREHCRYSPDALDAVLCLFGAKAAFEELATFGDAAAAIGEGWIAVHPV